MSEIIERIKHSPFVTWLLGLLSKPAHEAPSVHHEHHQPAADVMPVLTKPPTLRKKTKTQERPDTLTFSDLLDGLDDSFSSMSIPPIKGNWLSRKDIQSLHKLGIFIPTPWELEIVKHPTLECDSLPIAASCLMIQSKYERKQEMPDKAWPRFAFALREPSLPPSVEQVRGIPYRFGYCVELAETERGGPMRMFWTWAWVVVRTDGELVVPNELRQTHNEVNHRRRVTPGKVKGARSSSFVSRSWEKPRAFTADKSAQTSQEDYERFLLCVFRQLILWWKDRPNNWSVGVRKDGRRVTFGIDKKHTAHYFADRDKQADCNGANKKIIHYVREHKRSNGQTVKAHVRGLKHFHWRGYECSVVAPNFYGGVVTTFPIPPVEHDSSEKDVIELPDLTQLLANHEDSRRASA